MTRYAGFCQFHPDVETKMTCCRCHMYICPECRKSIGEEIYCPVCYYTPHIQKLAKKDRPTLRNSIPMVMLMGMVFAVVLAVGFGKLNAVHQGKMFFLPFFMGAFIGIFITVVAGARRGFEYQMISLLCSAVCFILGDFLYLKGSGDRIGSFIDYFIRFQSHSIYYYVSMALGLVNAYAIPAQRSLKTLGKGQKGGPDENIF